MGNLIGNLMKDLTSDSSEQVKERLTILQEMGDNIVLAESERMEVKALEDKFLPIVAIVDTKKVINMGATSGVSGKVNDVVSELFKGKYMDGLKKSVSVLLDTFLGNAQAGKQTCTEFHVVFDNNALLRVDLFFYNYTFSSEGFKEHGENLFCYVVQIGVLDSMKVDPQVTLFEVSKSVGFEAQKAKEMLEEDSEFIESLFAKLERLQKARKELKE